MPDLSLPSQSASISRVRACVVLCLMLVIGACRGARGEPSSETIDPRAAPVQQALTTDDVGSAASWGMEDARITKKARYRIAARVLSTERYYFGWQSELSPLDLALGWDDMSDPGVDQWIDWYQGTRWYFWRWSAASPYQNEAIASQSANVHIVPANPNVARAALALDADDVVVLQGWLVDIQGPSGEPWRSSLTREDRGDRSCELLYLAELIVDGTRYR